MIELCSLIQETKSLTHVIQEELHRRALVYMEAYFSDTDYDNSEIEIEEDLFYQPHLRVRYSLLKDNTFVQTGSLLIRNALTSMDSELIRCGKEDADNHSTYKISKQESKPNEGIDDRWF